jgi:hypothetical protein
MMDWLLGVVLLPHYARGSQLEDDTIWDSFLDEDSNEQYLIKINLLR